MLLLTANANVRILDTLDAADVLVHHNAIYSPLVLYRYLMLIGHLMLYTSSNSVSDDEAGTSVCEVSSKSDLQYLLCQL